MNDKQMMDNEKSTLDSTVWVSPVSRHAPAVDIYENDDELVLLANLPGVEERALQIEVARGLLTIEAETAAVEGGVKTAYYRQFKLSERIAADAGEAVLKDGVLTLRLPKSEAGKPKKIAVKTLH